MVKTWIWASTLGATVAVAGMALGVKPLVRRVIYAQAEARGLDLRLDELELRWFRAELKNVDVQLSGVPAIQTHLDHVQVGLSVNGSVNQILVNGGSIELQGRPELIMEQLRTWRAARAEPTHTTKPTKPNGRVEQLRNLHVVWRGAWGDHDEQQVSGLNLDRTPHTLRAGADLVEIQLDQFRARIAGASIETSREALQAGRIQTLGASEMRVSFRADQPSNEDQRRHPAPPDQAAAPLSQMLSPHPERTAQLRASLQLLREKVLPRLPDEAQVQHLWLSYSDGKEQLEIGPNRLSMENLAHEFKIAFVPGEQEKAAPAPLTLALRVPRGALAADEAALTLSLQGGPVALSTLGLNDGPFGLRGVSQTFLEGAVESRLSSDARLLSATGSLGIEGLSIDSRALSDEIVNFPRMHVRGAALVHTDGTRFSLDKVELSLAETRFSGGLNLERKAEAVHLQARATAPLVSCQGLVDSSPRGLLGPVADMKFSGTFSLNSSVNLDTSALSKMSVSWDFKNDCKISAVPRSLDPERFREIFEREVNGSGNFPMQVESGPGSASWVEYEEVSPYVESALLVSEDGRFFRHDGFDDRAIESAIADNAKAGRFVRGASTISMQLAKNLYLSRDKTLSRKLQEAALTSLLEQTFKKKELLELYVNVVEFGPGIYGIRQAAEHYFNTQPRDLSAAQAFFLGSVLPNPARTFFTSDGKMGETTLKYVHKLLQIARQRGLINDEELAAAESEELIFGQTSATHQELPPVASDLEPTEATTTRDERKRSAHPTPLERGIEL